MSFARKVLFLDATRCRIRGGSKRRVNKPVANVAFVRQASSSQRGTGHDIECKAKQRLAMLFVAVDGARPRAGPGGSPVWHGRRLGGFGGFGFGFGAFSQVPKPDSFLVLRRRLVDCPAQHSYPVARCLRQQSQLLHQSHTRQRLRRALRRRSERSLPTISYSPLPLGRRARGQPRRR